MTLITQSPCLGKTNPGVRNMSKRVLASGGGWVKAMTRKGNVEVFLVIKRLPVLFW